MSNDPSRAPTIESDGVNRMFAGIAGRYDRANRCLSLGIDIYWRARTVARVRKANRGRVASRPIGETHAANGGQNADPYTVIDLATGSGDIALALRKKLPSTSVVIGMDFCEPMLDEARKKAKDLSGVEFRTGDCLHLPLADESADALTIGFGLRNLEDRNAGLREMLRVLRPGGSLLVLEFSQPYALLRPFYYFYLNQILPRVAGRITGDVEAYHYLGGTIEAFPRREALAQQIQDAGFTKVTATPLTGGIVALHQAWKGKRR